MSKKLQEELKNQGFTNQEADYIANEYKDMEVSAEDCAVYDDADTYMMDSLESSGADTNNGLVKVLTEIADPDEYIERINNEAGNYDVITLPSGRIAEITFL